VTTLHFDQLHHPQGFNTSVKAFRAGRNTNQQEPSEQHKIALGKEGTRKPKIKLKTACKPTRCQQQDSKVGARSPARSATTWS